jgi:hypothetical protein
MKLNKYIFVFILYSLLFILSGCRPKGILHSWEMRDIMVDLHKTDALLQVSGLQYGHDEAANSYYAAVLEQHGVTQAQFDSSLVWYTAHPQLFDKIYPKVLAQLEKEKNAFEAAHRDELHMQPGIRMADIKQKAPRRPRLTQEQLDSMLWVTRHGYPTLWQPLPDSLMHDFKNQLLP